MAVAQDFEEFIACLTAHGVEFVTSALMRLRFTVLRASLAISTS